ncbi:PREDICTED: zinc finger BED domain-containing protein 4-like [Rhagoletis zephyria]|uniref:zinc finger BED domain-containing protein 4-like n=1 Tax=Rhagoletis zephyria TaxID=28612 RepID=UPI000811391F|nr:PREDICTED: zinc finger BED domain-containing protein 4-like [Rhagoletis zephyria]
MVQRILLIKEAISAVLLSTPKAPTVLTADEILQLEDLCLLLEPFNKNTSIVSANQYVTISHVIPIVCGLYSTMLKLESKLQTTEGYETCAYLAEKIKQRPFIYESRSTPRLATLLDPRFKKPGFRSPQNATQASILLENELAGINRTISSTSTDKNDEPSKPEDLEIPEIYEFMKEKLSSRIKSNRADAIIALREYAEKPNEPLNTDPLEYWKTRSNDMKQLQVLASKYLYIPATSTKSERMFSKAGEIVSDRRSRLKAKNVNMLLFISKNYELMN